MCCDMKPDLHLAPYTVGKSVDFKEVMMRQPEFCEKN